MPRPKKWRRVCCLPENNIFAPVGACRPETEPVPVLMTVDEYETIRLIDYKGLTQEECSVYMNIARTTVQQIYNDARKKLSILLVEGRHLHIGGGEYRLCGGEGPYCGRGACRRHLESTQQLKGENEE